ARVSVLIYTSHGARSNRNRTRFLPALSFIRPLLPPAGSPVRRQTGVFILAGHMSDKARRKDKLWSGRFEEPVTDLVKRFTASVAFDQRLAPFDIEGSLAHARMLHATGIISADDLAAIERGLAEIGGEIERG